MLSACEIQDITKKKIEGDYFDEDGYIDAMETGTFPSLSLNTRKVRQEGYDKGETVKLSRLFEAIVNLIRHSTTGVTTDDLFVILSGMVPDLGAKEYRALCELGILEEIESDFYLNNMTICVHVDSFYLKKG